MECKATGRGGEYLGYFRAGVVRVVPVAEIKANNE